MRRSLLIRLLLPYAVALIAVAGSLYVYGDAVVERLYLSTLSQHVLRQARLVGESLPWGAPDDLLDEQCQRFGRALDLRVTVIAPDGTVLGDSEAPAALLPNQRDRSEIHDAFVNGEGQGIGESISLGTRLFHRTLRQVDGNRRRVIRLSVPMEAMTSFRSDLARWIIGGVLIAALAAFWPALVLSRRLSTRITHLAEFSEAVASGGDPGTLTPQGDDVITTLEASLAAMAQTLRTQLAIVHEEKSKLEAVLAGMVEGVLVLDRGGVVRLANQRVEQLLGTPLSVLLYQPLVTASRDPDLLDLVRTITRGDQSEAIVREINLERATRETLRVTATPILGRDGDPPLFILVFHDITQMKKVEAMRRDFVANVSHELRTPLTAIRGYTETLQGGAVKNPELAAKFLSVIERHSERLSRLVDDLLTLSDLELGRAALQRSSLQLEAVVDAAVDVLHRKAEAAGVVIRRQLPEDLPLLYADPDRLEQVLLNLIDNAVKYTPAGGFITITARPLSSIPNEPNSPVAMLGDAWLEIRVADTGVGVPPQDLPRLTERFYRVDKARSRELGGTGLGLAIVKHIVQSHAGRLRIDSELGQGTQVSIYLPLQRLDKAT